MAAGPDQGFAWVIAFSCFFINFIMAGLARTAGVLFVAIIDLYGVSREAATTPFSIRVCVRNMTGPVIGLLGQKYGIRILTTVGSLIAALGSILCYFAPNVFWITVFWGIIHGLGFGLSTVLHMLTVNQYFDKYKASALGLGYSGDCFGSFAFPILMEHLFAMYGVRGSFLILGGIVLNTLPLALLLRKPPWLRNVSKPKVKKNNLKKITEHLGNENVTTHYQRCERNNKITKSRSQVGMLSTVNEVENFERKKSDNIKLSENGSGVKQFSTFGYDQKGQYNKAFVLSESDLNSENTCNIAKSLTNLNSQKSSASSENKNLAVPQSSRNNIASTSKAFQCPDIHCSHSSLCDSKCTDDRRVCSEIKMSRSATDLKSKALAFSHLNRSLRLNKAQDLNLMDRRVSMPYVPKKETKAKEKCENSIPEDDVKDDITSEAEAPRIDDTGMLRKRRTSSFVEVAHDFVNRMRTASFASSVAQDAFCSPIPQELESDSEQELECELKSIVEHRNHDFNNCTHHDLILSVDRNMMEDYFNEVPEEPVVEKKLKPPSLFKVMLRTNTKPMFILISISMAVYAFLFCSVLTIIIDYASDLGIPQEKGKYLLIGFSVADLIGRLSFGQVIDRKLMKMKNYSGSTMLLMGALVAVIPLNVSFNYMMVCMCMYGLVQGGTAIMFPILINTYMDRNSESVAMGCVNFYGGLLMLFMAPMIGYFRDNTGSYNYVFYIIGGVVAVVGIVWQFEPMIIKFQNRKLREKYIMRELSVASFQQ